MADKSKTRLDLPSGLSPAEEARWWDEHPEYWEQDDIETLVRPPQPLRRTQGLPYLRLPVDLVDAIKEQAGVRGVSYQHLVWKWLEERLEVECSGGTNDRRIG